MTTDAESVFIDTNVLVYANAEEAPKHDLALSRIQDYRNDECAVWISSQVLREYLVCMSRPQMFQKPVSIETLCQVVTEFRAAFYVAHDSPAVVERLLALVKEVPIGGKQIHDANIVATMLEHGVTHLLTDNAKDFERFSSHITILPLSE